MVEAQDVCSFAWGFGKAYALIATRVARDTRLDAYIEFFMTGKPCRTQVSLLLHTYLLEKYSTSTFKQSYTLMEGLTAVSSLSEQVNILSCVGEVAMCMQVFRLIAERIPHVQQLFEPVGFSSLVCGFAHVRYFHPSAMQQLSVCIKREVKFFGLQVQHT